MRGALAVGGCLALLAVIAAAARDGERPRLRSALVVVGGLLGAAAGWALDNPECQILSMTSESSHQGFIKFGALAGAFAGAAIAVGFDVVDRAAGRRRRRRGRPNDSPLLAGLVALLFAAQPLLALPYVRAARERERYVLRNILFGG